MHREKEQKLDLIRQRFKRGLATYNRAAVVQLEMAETIIALLREIRPHGRFDRGLELGCGAGLLTDLLEQTFVFDHLELVDLVAECAGFHGHRRNVSFVAGDLETVKLDGRFSLIAANAALQWVEEPATLYARLAAAMSPDGVLAFSSFAPGNLGEINELAGGGLHYSSPDETISQLTPYFEVIHCFAAERRLEFASPMAVLHHLRNTGVTGVAPGRSWTRHELDEFTSGYRRCFGTPHGGVTLTYRPLFAIAVKH
ncbi:MAG: methyltransferase domain-containing protein [Victivallaceae bacterium]|nr:methyltransferase domain-containing protein [Victivallaceae bacterium]